jgi:pimeloyl-ACP methyl ester carboxylesterase
LMAALKPRSAGCARGRWLMSEVRRHDTAALLDAIGELGSFDSGEWLGAGEQPSAVVVMAQDIVVSAEAQHDLARSLRRCRVYEMEGDHFACVKRPAQFNSLLTAACAQLLAPA